MAECDCISIIGIDCATQPAKTGVVFARYSNQRIDLISNINAGDISDYSPLPDHRWYPLVKKCQSFIGNEEKVLFCMDSPLGWPNMMRETLAGADFIEKRCHEPPDRKQVEREGWIWFSS